MEKKVTNLMKAGVLSTAAALLILVGPSAVTAEKVTQVAASSTMQVGLNWKDFHSVSGNCTMKFPEYPQHVSENMNVPEEGYNLKYDAYISASEQKTVYMLLIAQYPEFVNESYARMSLESFLNGILSHNPGNQLIFADLTLVDGHEALDFFIRTGGVYFKGRAMMVKNSLYLMAMECEVKTYDEAHYNHFITSFQLAK
jgi:hypothetical protein